MYLAKKDFIVVVQPLADPADFFSLHSDADAKEGTDGVLFGKYPRGHFEFLGGPENTRPKYKCLVVSAANPPKPSPCLVQDIGRKVDLPDSIEVNVHGLALTKGIFSFFGKPGTIMYEAGCTQNLHRRSRIT